MNCKSCGTQNLEVREFVQGEDFGIDDSGEIYSRGKYWWHREIQPKYCPLCGVKIEVQNE